MNKSEIEKDVRRYLQREFYVGNKTDDYQNQLQHAAAKYVYTTYPEIIRVIVKVDYFGQISIDLQ